MTQEQFLFMIAGALALIGIIFLLWAAKTIARWYIEDICNERYADIISNIQDKNRDLYLKSLKLEAEASVFNAFMLNQISKDQKAKR